MAWPNPERCEHCGERKVNPLGLCRCGRFPSQRHLDTILCAREGCTNVLQYENDKNVIWDDKRYCTWNCVRIVQRSL